MVQVATVAIIPVAAIDNHKQPAWYQWPNKARGLWDRLAGLSRQQRRLSNSKQPWQGNHQLRLLMI